MAKKRIIELTVDREYVTGAGVVIGAAGSHDDVVLRVAFGDTWIGYNIYATFRDALGEHPTTVLLMPSMLVSGETQVYDVLIPAAAKRVVGRAMLTLSGYSLREDGTEEDAATNTATAYFRVLPSDFALADDGSIDATLAQQLQAEVREHEEVVQAQIEGHKAELAAEIEDHKTEVAAKITEHETKVEEEIESLYGASGSLTVPVTAWSGKSASVTVSGIGDSDMILFSPTTEADKNTLNSCGVFISPAVAGGVARLTCRVKPTAAISLVYFISRGA